MTVDARASRRAHETLDLRSVAESVPTLSTYERSEERRRVLVFLREQVTPNTALDYALLGDEQATRSLSYDKLAIRHWIELLAAADVANTPRLQALLYGLDALIRVHIWKENELLLAMLESRNGAPSLVA